ncbi:hypothetical protein NLG97_g5623 [Lecanicillium saksenae]|uniref:Uncharacterized protein n=1 Tax=Lecanicillium saksenae TaxID=468837 RepID=A0ACC1QS42_9HYPO|nr:hypothetical protein NLG97_g5623 [Lecanicillium saksenae]
MGRTVIVASKNPLKIGATTDGFTRMFPDGNFDFKGCSVGSGVSDQPLTDQETLQGALNRARNAQELEPAAMYWVGLEGGVQTVDNEVQAFAWIVVLGRDNKMGRARTSTFFLPQETTKLLRSGLELGDADNLLYGKTNSKHQTGTVGILTGDLITRQSYYAEAVVLALIPFKNTQLTFGPDPAGEESGKPAALDKSVV